MKHKHDLICLSQPSVSLKLYCLPLYKCKKCLQLFSVDDENKYELVKVIINEDQK